MTGKRKRRANNKKSSPPPPSPEDFHPHSSQIDSLLKQKVSHRIDVDEAKPSSSNMDSVDISVKDSQADQSPDLQHHSSSQALALKHPHQNYSYHYSRRSSGNHEASASHGKGTYPRDQKLSFKLSSKHYFDSGCHRESENRAFCKPEKIRRGLLATDASSSDAMKMVCGICEKLLRKKPYIVVNTIASSDLSVVAVLVCGHLYHADCLEQRTCHENRGDPPCPLCASLLPEADTSKAPQL